MSAPIQDFRRGTSIFFRIEVRDVTDPTQPLYSPSGGVKITLRKADGSVAVSLGAMTAYSTGIFTYVYATSSTETALGVWRVFIKASGAANDAYTVTQDAFRLVPE